MSALSAAGGGASASGGTAPKLATKSKFHKLDINNLYCHSRGESSEPSSVKSQLNRKHGMQSLGKVPSARRPPANLPSLKTESGLDPTSSSSTSSSSSPPVTASGATSATSSTATAATSSTTPTTSSASSAPSAAPPTQPCPPPSSQSHQHATAFQGGWAALPHHRSAQFQQDFPSLDGSSQSHASGPSLRPQTEGSWMSGGSRGGAADGPAPAGDIRSAPNHLHRALIPNFMYKGSAGSGGNNAFPPVFGSQTSSQGPQGRHPPANRGPPRTRELTTMDKLVQTPIIKEEELNSMDEIAQDAAWFTNDDVDFTPKISLSDDESPPKETAPSGRDTRGSSKDSSDNKAQSPAPAPPSSAASQDKRQNVIKGLDEDELWAMRRQHSSELAVVAERAKQRKQQEERRYEEERRARQQESQGQNPAIADSEQSSTVTGEKEKSGDSGGKLNRSSSRDNVRNGSEASDFRQLTQIEGRGFRDQGKDRDKNRYERDYRDSRDRDHPRTERERSDRDGTFKTFFYTNMPPRFMKQSRNQQQGPDDYNSRHSAERQDSKEKQEKAVPFAQQYDTRFAYPNVKPVSQGSKGDSKKSEMDSNKGLRRTRTDSDIGNKDGEKTDDLRRERHTPDEPRHPRHAPRKLSGSSDGRGREYDDEYQRWEKDHDRRSGSKEYNREGSYDWRSSDKDYDKGRNYREIDRQSSRESQKEFSDGGRKNDFERKSSVGYDKTEKVEDFNRKTSQDFDSRKSVEKFDKQPDRPDSRDSRESSFKSDTTSDKPSRTDHPQDDSYAKSGRNDSINNYGQAKKESDDARRTGIQIKKSPSNLQKSDIATAKDQKNDGEAGLQKGAEGSAIAKTDPPKAWSEAINPLLASNKGQDDKDAEKGDSGKERLERKLSSSGSEKKSSTGSRNRLDSGGSRRGIVYYRGGNWSGRGSDSRRRGHNRQGQSRSNRDYSESEMSGDEHLGENKSKKSRSPKSKKAEKDDKNKNIGTGNTSNGSLQSVSGSDTQRFSSNDNLNQKKRHDSRGEGREAFTPRGEPSRRGRGGFRGRVSHGVASKVPFNPSSKIEESNDLSKGESINPEDKNRSKQHSAGAIGRERRGGSPRSHDKKPRGRTGGPASGEEEAWETTSEHSEGGTSRQVKRKTQPRGGKSVEKKPSQNNRGPGQMQNRQNSSGNIVKPKKDDPNALTTSLSDMKISSKTNKDGKKDSSEEGHVDDGFQEVRNKKTVKDVRGGVPQKEEIVPVAKTQKPQKEGQRNNSSSRSAPEKPAGGNMNRGPPSSGPKVNGPQLGHHDRPMGPPSKPNQYDRNIRQNNLPPRFIRQMEHNWMQKQQNRQGFNPGHPSDPNVTMQGISAWDKPINPALRTGMENEQSLVIGNVTIPATESGEMATLENHSGHSSQRSTPNTSAGMDQKAPGSMVNMEKSGILDGTTTPVKTIIFENTNYKSGPDSHKQKFAPVGNQQNVAVPNKNQQCAPSKALLNQPSDLDTQILNFTESQQSAPFISDLISGETAQSGNNKDAALQLPITFKNAEDSSDMKLDFFDTELSQLTDDKSTKGLGISRMHGMGSAQNSISTATDQELNMKIASVKKVWDNNVMEHPTSEESSHSQHTLTSQHMSVSSPHSMTSQHSIGTHHITSQHNLATQHAMSQHNLGVSQHSLSSQHGIAVSSSTGQYASGFDDHQTSNDVQSQGFSPSNAGVANQAMNVCKVKSAQQTLHSNQSMTGLQNMQTTLMGQNTPLQSMSQTTAALQSIQGVGGVMGLSPPPIQHTYNHINYPGNQYGGLSAIPSPPTVLFNSSQPLLSSSQQMPSQGGLYNAFQIDQTRSQYGGFPSGPYGAGSTPYNYQPDMFQGIQNQYRMQDLFQPNNAFGQSGQLGTNPNTMLISSSTNSLMSASIKPSSQQIGPIGTKGTSYQAQQYLGYGAPHDSQAPPYPTTIPPPSLVRATPQAAHPPPLQAPSTYYSQNTVGGGQTGFYQQTGNVSANYGLQFNQASQNHSNAGLQGFGSQVMSSPFPMAAAMQQQYGRTAHQAPYVSSGSAGGKQEHQVPHPSTPQQLKSPLQDHLNNGMFGGTSQVGGSFGAPGGSASPKGNPNTGANNGKPVSGPISGFNSANNQGNKAAGSQHSPPQHKYQQSYHMQQVMQANGRQPALNMAMNRGNIQQQRYPGPIQRPHAPPSSHQQQQSNYNRSGNNRHISGGNQPHQRHPGPGNNAYSNYQQNLARSTPQPTVPPSTPEPPKVASATEEPPASSGGTTATSAATPTSEPPAAAPVTTTVATPSATAPAPAEPASEPSASDN